MTIISFNEENKYVFELKELLQKSNIPFLIDINEFSSLPESFKKEIEKSYIKIYPDDACS